MQTATLKGSRLSPQQARLWSLQERNQAYHIQCALVLEGQLQTAALQQALQQIVHRYKILRTTFYSLPGVDIPLQVVTGDVELVCLQEDMKDGENLACQIDERLAKEREKPFDHASDPPLRASLLRLSAEKYLLLLNVSALCADAATLNHLIIEIGEAYAACVQGKERTEEPLQYGDVSAWQHALLASEDAEEQKAYWRAVDQSQLTASSLPFQRFSQTGHGKSDGHVGSFAPRHLEVPVESTTYNQIKGLIQHADVSLEAFLLTCWQVLIWRLTAETKFLVGVACDGRFYEELARAIGPYTRVVPMQAHIERDRPFAEILSQTGKFLDDTKEEQYYFTWEQFASPVTGEQEPPFFPISFEFEDWPLPLKSMGVLFSCYRRFSCSERFVLKLRAISISDGIRLELHYDPLSLPDAHVQRIAATLQTLLRGAATQPQMLSGKLPLLEDVEQRRLAQEFTGPNDAYPQWPLQHLFEIQVERTPTQFAVLCGEEQLSYQELNTQANQLAHYLCRQGVGPNTLVGLYLERSTTMIVGLLAILKAGGAYVPLDPDIPPARLGYQLADIQAEARIALVLTQEKLLARLPQWDGRILCLETIAPHVAEQEESNPPVAKGLENLAYVMYTSGSTGVPKGVAIRQRSVVNYTTYMCSRIASRGEHQFATVSTLAADLGNTIIFCSLVSGGCLHILPYEIVTSGELFARYVAENPIDILKIVPSHLSSLLAALPEDRRSTLLPRVALILGGEAFPVALARQLKNLSGNCAVFNHYGPTETTIGVLTNKLSSQDKHFVEDERLSTIPLGRPIANAEVYILDSYQQIVPVGVAGELYIGGVGLAAGYLHQQEQTRERFVAHPLRTGERVYKTGDLARYTDDGQIEFLGRMDSQVKLRGYRIELGEIEAVLDRHPNVRECVAMVYTNSASESGLALYVVARQQPAPTSAELRSYLHDYLPNYMLPSTFVFLRVLPLTANGKVDRAALPPPDDYASEIKKISVGPRSPIEEVLVSIWEEVLHAKHISIHDDFTSLGGHSLLATQIISRIRSALRVEVPLRSLFESPTVAGLAGRVESILRSEQGVSAPPMVPVPREQDLPLSFAQQRLWFLDQLDPGASSYNKPVTVRLHGILNVASLERSLGEIVRRHEILRTTFHMHENQPVQIIKQADPFHLPWKDLYELTQEEQEAEVRRLAAEEAHHPFDLTDGPLLRIMLLRLGADENVLFLNMHHSISDGWSNGVFVRELTALYTAFIEDKPSPLSELPIQYADFAVWQQQWLQGEMLEAQLNYWKQQLGEVQPLNLPTDRPRPVIQTFRGDRRSIVLSPKLSDEIKKLSQREDVTLFMILLAAFQLLLARYTAQEDIFIGTPIANRNWREVEDLIGFFVNTLVMHTNFSGNPTFRDLLSRVREMALGAYAHQDLPFEKLVEALQPERDLSRSPLFQVMFLLQNTPMPPQELPGLRVNTLESESTVAKFDLTLAVVDTEQGLHCGLEYNTDLFDRATIVHMLGHWQTLLEAVTTDVLLHAADLPLLTPGEREQIVVAWNDTQTAYPEHLCIHHLFEAQVRRTPEAVALVCEEECCTYEELNRRANQLAHELQSMGVGPDVLVALCAERSIEIVIGLLAILKAGGAYVPLDPVYPSERLNFMLKDAQAAVLLTQEHLIEQFQEHQVQVMYLDRGRQALINEENPGSTVMPQHLAYLIYTSGSTGRPKGVAIEHQSVVAMLDWVRRTFTSTQLEGVLASTSICFDLSIYELFGPLSWGGKVVLVENILSWAQLPARNDVVLINTVPSVMAELLRMYEIPGSVRTVNLAGEALPATLVEQLYSLETIDQVYNLYGPSEDTTYSTWCLLERDSKHVPGIGRPLSNTQIYLLDAHLTPVPIGVPGELYISGTGLARGYFKRPDITAERFVPNPFSREPGARMYQTGDQARYLPNGAIEYVGRIDNQVKIRGFRIELDEVESVLAWHPGLRECVVVSSEDARGEKRLVAYVVAKEDHTLSTGELRSFLKMQLPDYMLPTLFFAIKSFPLLPNGKVDRQALSMLSHENGTKATGKPRNTTEFQLIQIWEKLLDQQPIGVTDNFFELGGHSILAVRLMAQIRRDFGQDIALSALFQHPTIAQLAVLLRQKNEPEHWSILAAIQTEGTKIPFFCVHPAGGTVFRYYALARHLGADQPFYGLQTPDLDGKGTTYSNVPEMAARYIASMQHVRPQGPYLLGGWSLGGVIAFEMAQQLRQQGHEVALLALIDTSILHRNGNKVSREPDTSDDALARHLIERNAIAIPGEEFYARDPREQLLYILEQGKAAGVIPEDTTIVQFRRFQRMQFINMHAVSSYVPEVYPGRIVLLRANDDVGREEGEFLQNRARGWDQFAMQSVEVRLVPGSHADMIDEPNVAGLASALRECIAHVYTL